MSALQTVTTSVVVDSILPGDPPMLAWHKWLRGTAGRQKVHTQWVQVRDAGLLASLREQVQVGEEIEVTIATDWTVEGAPSYLVGFVLPEHMTEKPATMRIAIDGPSASGKSAVGSRVAARLGYPFVDTGSMYRAITWLALRCGVDPENAAGLAALAEPARLEIGPPPMDGRETCSISVNGVDITRALRDTDVERNVSQVSAVPAVRAVMVRLQRDAAPANVVMAGRDIGTVVLPDAELKVYFEASVDVRAVRRQVELAEKGRVETLDQVRADLQRRDAIDSSRATSPLRPAEDAVTIDTDALTIDDVVDLVLRLAVERGATLPEDGGQIRSAPTEPARPEAGRTR